MTDVPLKYLVETYGCQMNVHDSERMTGLLEGAGYAPAASDRDADVIVINTCSVREHAEGKLYTRLGEIRVTSQETGTRPIVAVTGCVAQQEQAALTARMPHVDLIVGTQALRDLPKLIERAANQAIRRTLVDVSPREDVSFPLGVIRRDDPVRARVTIIEGCNDFCAFCVVPYTRGHERMRPVAEILADVADAAQKGHQEVQLLGQIVNHYHAPDDERCDFAELLRRVHEVPGITRIRFASPHPRHMNRSLIETIRDLPKVCRHLHLPLQSGSNTVLQRMRRRHTREWYLQLVDDLRAAIPDIALSTDMIVGFPGETPAEFEDTLSLVRQVRFHSMFSFKYSPRPNTLALKRMQDDVTEDEKTRRIVELQAVQRAIQVELHAAMVGREVPVLVDAISKRRDHEVSGRTSQNAVVNLPGVPSLIGQEVRVLIERSGPHSLWGRPISASA